MFSTLLKPILYLVLALLLISVGINVYQHIDLSAKKADIAKLDTANTNYKSEVLDLGKTITDQNLQIMNAKKIADQNDVQIKNLGDQLVVKNLADKAIIDKLSKAPAPKTCDAAKDYLKSDVGSFKL
jgi:cell division protein FtsL